MTEFVNFFSFVFELGVTSSKVSVESTRVDVDELILEESKILKKTECVRSKLIAFFVENFRHGVLKLKICL